MWSTQRLAGTGADDVGSVTVYGTQISYLFRQGEGITTEEDIVGAITRIKLASMVISSGKILQALADQINAGLSSLLPARSPVPNAPKPSLTPNAPTAARGGLTMDIASGRSVPPLRAWVIP